MIYPYYIFEIVEVACHVHVCLNDFYFLIIWMKFYGVHL